MKVAFSILVTLLAIAGLYFLLKPPTWLVGFEAYPVQQILFAGLILLFSLVILSIHYFEKISSRENWARFSILIGLLLVAGFFYSLQISAGSLLRIIPSAWEKTVSCVQIEGMKYSTAIDTTAAEHLKACIPMIPLPIKYSLVMAGIFFSLLLQFLLFWAKAKWLKGLMGQRLTFTFDYVWWLFVLQCFALGYHSLALLIFINAFLLSYILIFLLTTHLYPVKADGLPKMDAKPPGNDSSLPRGDAGPSKGDPPKK